MAATEKTIAGTAPGLRRNAIGLREVLFQSITDMAPGAANLYRTNPGRISDVGLVHLDAIEEDAASE